jgi:hypothetical protein
MDELPSRARSVLSSARPYDECRDPSARARVLAGVLSATAVSSIGRTAAPERPAPSHGAWLGRLRSKALLSTGVLALVGTGVWLGHGAAPEHARGPVHVPAVAVQGEEPEVAAAQPTEHLVAPLAPARREQRDTLDAELALLESADRALGAGTPERAQRLLRQHHARFPRSVLGVERAGLDVLVRCTVGAPGAVEAARAFVGDHAHSVVTRRVQRACMAPEVQP